MITLFESIYDITFGLVIQFIQLILGRSGLDLTLIPIKVGFGSIEWVNSNLYEVITLIGTITIGVVFIMLVWKVFKFFTKLVNKAFGGRKW